MSDDGFEEFSDRNSGSEERMDVGAVVSTDFFGEDNREYQETTVDSPFEIPYSNMRDLGRRKPKLLKTEETIHLPARDNDVNIGMPERSASASAQLSEAEEEEQNEGGMTDLMKSFLRRGQEDTNSPPPEAIRDTQAKLGVPDILPAKKSKTMQEDYEERIAKFANSGVAINGIMEEDEFGDEDPLVLLGLAEKKKKKKKKEKPADEKLDRPATTSQGYSVGVEKPTGLTSSVQAQAAALQREKDKMEALHVIFVD